MKIAFIGYPGMTPLDLVGPWQVLSFANRGGTMHLLAAEPGLIESDSILGIRATATLAEVPTADVIVVPGAGDPFAPIADGRVVSWLRAAAPSASLVTSVCTGSVILAAAGLLEGRRATTHWAYREELAARGVVVAQERVVEDGNVITAAGVSAGIDMGLTLAARLWGDVAAKTAQAVLEYDPEPPFDAGSPDKLPPEVEAGLRENFAGFIASARGR